ncbi:MAG: aminotransferase class I/II-fold pyridoxal phosphate-dependent enzyme [Balneolaceae bacterium]
MSQLDINEFRKMGHQLVDRMAEYLEGVEDQALFPDVSPKHLEKLFSEPLPEHSVPAEEILEELEEKLFPFCCHVNHPGYFGFITSTPTPVGILGDFICSALNQNLGLYTIGPGAVTLERRAVRWLSDLVGYNEQAGGHLTSGGTMANLEGIKLARDRVSDNKVQHEGIRNQWAVYVSEERHVSIDKAVDIIGVGRDALRKIPTNNKFQINIEALEEAIAADRNQGIKPMCVIGLAGTTNTGAIDPLKTLKKIAEREEVWFHVDAAYGGGMLLSNKWPGLLEGIELADSITIDPHKWFFAPLDAGAILVKDRTQLTRSFGMEPAYLIDEMDHEKARFDYYVHSLEQSRRFRGLKVWMSFKRYGSKEIGRWIDSNVEQTLHLYSLCKEHPNFEPATYPPMSAICIRYQSTDLGEEHSKRLHREVARRVEENGNYWITTTHLKGKSWFRINPVNFRTRIEHMEGLLSELQHECERVASSLKNQ